MLDGGLFDPLRPFLCPIASGSDPFFTSAALFNKPLSGSVRFEPVILPFPHREVHHESLTGLRSTRPHSVVQSFKPLGHYLLYITPTAHCPRLDGIICTALFALHLRPRQIDRLLINISPISDTFVPSTLRIYSGFSADTTVHSKVPGLGSRLLPI